MKGNPETDDLEMYAVVVRSYAADTLVPDIKEESEVAQKPGVTTKPGMTRNSDIAGSVAKDTTEEIDIETLRRKVQEMKRKGDQGWES